LRQKNFALENWRSSATRAWTEPQTCARQPFSLALLMVAAFLPGIYVEMKFVQEAQHDGSHDDAHDGYERQPAEQGVTTGK
jgi:hypothetical protein